jgi:choline transport protein
MISSANDCSVLQTATAYPYIQIFYNVTGSLPATNAMTALILILGFFGNVTVMAGSSRQLFAFARDEGMPFSRWISKVAHDRSNPRFVT